MFMTSEIARKFTAAVLTVVFSSIAVIGAVGPAQADQTPTTVRVA